MLDRDDEQVIKDAKDGGAVLITWDRVLRLAAGGITPYEAMDEALESGAETKEARSELSRLRSLTPVQLTAFREAGNRIYDLLRQHIELRRESVKLVRQLRVEKDYSWRAIARFYSQLWGAPWGGNQLAGMVICEKSAKLLGEDFMQPPWN